MTFKPIGTMAEAIETDRDATAAAFGAPARVRTAP